jgi:nucleotide-binding universal stress UspA family protein
MYGGLEEVHQTLAEFLETDTPAARALRQAAAVMEKTGVQAEIQLSYGVTDRELLRTAQEGDYDLLILGSAWARPAIDRVVLENITRNVLLQTQRPVLVVYPANQKGIHT